MRCFGRAWGDAKWLEIQRSEGLSVLKIGILLGLSFGANELEVLQQVIDLGAEEVDVQVAEDGKG